MQQRHPKLQRLIDSLSEYKRMEREKKTSATLEEILELIWQFTTQAKVQTHLGISTSQSTITEFIEEITGWEIKKISEVNTLKDKLAIIADNLIEEEASVTPPARCSAETLETIYKQQKAKKMVELEVILESNVIRKDSPRYLEMVKAAAVPAIAVGA